jgi:Ca-activated chloride channel family protein
MDSGRTVQIGVLLLALCLALAGCGGSAGAPASAAPTAGSAARQQAPQQPNSALAPTAAAGVIAPAAPVGTSSDAYSQQQEAAKQAAPAGDQAQPVPAEATAASVAAPTAAAAGPTAPSEPAAATAVAPEAGAVNPFVRTSKDALSTFAIDVDTASYSAARNYLLNAGQLPPADTVRVEEFINYFRYDYPSPSKGAFGINIDAAPSPFNQGNTKLVRVGIQGQRIDASQRSDASLTFVIDISGSMQEPNRLPLVKRALRLLVQELRPSDQVGIVVYGSSASVVLDHTSAADKETIIRAIDSLENGGSTNAEEGLRLGYQQASKHFKTGASNRVILCSDGVANVGATGPDAIRQSIRDYTAQGVYLTTVGFGMGDYNDTLMEQLADDGNGNYAYVDTDEEARRIFVENLTGTLQVIAKDAKIQVEFNPAVVAQYRLLGYENRAVADQDFRNDKVDAGEVGASHSVTALYEVVLTGQGEGTALTVRMRYADPKTNQVSELAQPFESTAIAKEFAASPARLQQAVAVAAFAERLRKSGYAQDRPLDQVLAIAQRIAPQLPNDKDFQEFITLLQRAQQLGG